MHGDCQWLLCFSYMIVCDLQQSSGCLGCYKKPTLITSVDEPSKGSKIQGQTVKKPSISEDFWTTSTCDMDNSAVQSQGSMSSISTINQIHDPHGGSSSTNAPSEFVNHGLFLWNQTRQRWVGDKRSGNLAQQSREPKLNWNATYDSLLGSNKPFPQPIPLSEMVDFLVDIWEQEGMYD
ncbi:uncharacterized protein LOC110659025 isoform X3 [Hevea brasiliensis]|uniref:uncharacterized protein LOC110659025 isoform X3 n=1 Tax=Hevea brasiliensis TaxID=3981 RepID=UPI000B77BF22|nr:uncharacterized protein LOC110659025 isoform X3 [Hevea brasiliensis]